MCHGQNINSSFVTKKSAPTEPCKRMICRRVKIFQITGSVLLADGEGWGWGENTKKISPSTADITNDGHYTSTQPICLNGMAFSFTYTQTEIADTDNQMETIPRISLLHVAVQSEVSKSSAHKETNIKHSTHIELKSQNN